jgi:arginase
MAKGLGERLEAQRAGRVEPLQNDHRRDPETMLLNPRGIAAYSVALADGSNA